jgi:two-component system sensor histidine kinase AdeS
MMSLLNLGVTLLSFMIGYFVYSWAIEIGFLDFQSVNSNEFSSHP